MKSLFQIYALNKIMTDLENKRFREFCEKKGISITQQYYMYRFVILSICPYSADAFLEWLSPSNQSISMSNKNSLRQSPERFVSWSLSIKEFIGDALPRKAISVQNGRKPCPCDIILAQSSGVSIGEEVTTLEAVVCHEQNHITTFLRQSSCSVY